MELETSRSIGIVRVLNHNTNDCAVRLFYASVRCSDANPSGTFDGPNEGATIGVSDTPCTGNEMCGGTVCGRIVQSVESQEYEVDCAGAEGRFIYVQLPGELRQLHLRATAGPSMCMPMYT